MKKLSLVVVFMAAVLAWDGRADPTVVSVITNGLFDPFGITVDGTNNYYLTDNSHRVFKYNPDSGVFTVMAGANSQVGYINGPGFLARFYSPKGVAIYRGGLVVADSGNHLLRNITLSGNIAIVSTFAGFNNAPGPANNATRLTATFNSPAGLATDSTNLFIADSKNNAVRKLDRNDNITTIVGNLFEPQILAVDTNGVLYVADTRDQMIVMLTPQSNGTYISTNLAGSISQISGTNDDYFAYNARFNYPAGLLWVGGNTGLLVSDTGNHTLRRVYVNSDLTAYYGITTWSVATYAGAPGTPSLTDGAITTAKFNNPSSLIMDLNGGLLVVDSGNNALRRIQLGAARTQVADPIIGYVTMVTNNAGAVVSKLVPISDSTFYNDNTIAILGDPNTVTWTSGPTPGLFQPDTIPIPVPNVTGQTPPPYVDGLVPSQLPRTLISSQPDVTIKAIGTAVDHNPSRLIQARIQYTASPPTINGDSPSSLQLINATTGATMWYSIDDIGTNNVPQTNVHGAYLNGETISLLITNDVVLKVQAFKSNYQPSQIVLKTVSFTNFTANRISFGFDNGECSSDFLAGQGQHYFAPVTLNLLDNQTIWGLQFNIYLTNLTGSNVMPTNIWGANFGNLAVLGSSNLWITNLWRNILWGTNLTTTNQWVTNFWVANWTNYLANSNLWFTNLMSGSYLQANPSGANLLITNLYGTNLMLQALQAPPVAPATTTFTSMLVTNIPGSTFYSPIPPFLMYFTNISGTNVVTNANMTFTNTSINLLGVGWVESAKSSIVVTNFTNVFGGDLLFPRSQDLVSFSQAHDTLFSGSAGKVIVGAYEFIVPSTADFGQTYWMRLGRPSANGDGISADVFIDAPYGSFRNKGGLNAIKEVTVGQRRYMVGDVAPFRWFNAGDFGDQNLLNNDVVQIFRSAVYHYNIPPRTSDFYNAMDASDGLHNGIWDGNDTSINAISQGDGQINVDDVFVVFRRSLDFTLTNYVRYWSGGVRLAAATNNWFRGQLDWPYHPDKPAQTYTINLADLPPNMDSILVSTDTPTVRFIAGDIQGQPGQRVQIPISAHITGKYPVRVLMLNVQVESLENSAPITQSIQFTPVPNLGTPLLTDSKGANNYAAAWLDNSAPGVWGNSVVGTLSVTIPPNASPQAAYRISFPHISASPNGLVLFPQSVQAGLITLGSQQTSSWNDGIPDVWRLRYFGSVSNPLSAASTDPDGDGVSNRSEYLAGTDPLDGNSVWRLSGLRVVIGQDATASLGLALRWTTVAGRKYAVEFSAALNGLQWTPLANNLVGTGQELQYVDPVVSNQNRYYRIRLVE